MVYKNTSTTNLNFSLVSNVITDYGGSPFQLYVSRVDIPAITDVDNDGDLDILTFQSLGGYIEFQKTKVWTFTGIVIALFLKNDRDLLEGAMFMKGSILIFWERLQYYSIIQQTYWFLYIGLLILIMTQTKT